MNPDMPPPGKPSVQTPRPATHELTPERVKAELKRTRQNMEARTAETPPNPTPLPPPPQKKNDSAIIDGRIIDLSDSAELTPEACKAVLREAQRKAKKSLEQTQSVKVVKKDEA